MNVADLQRRASLSREFLFVPQGAIDAVREFLEQYPAKMTTEVGAAKLQDFSYDSNGALHVQPYYEAEGFVVVIPEWLISTIQTTSTKVARLDGLKAELEDGQVVSCVALLRLSHRGTVGTEVLSESV